jgi:hypothetical protein
VQAPQLPLAQGVAEQDEHHLGDNHVLGARLKITQVVETFQLTMPLLDVAVVFRFTIIWEKIIMIIGEKRVGFIRIIEAGLDWGVIDRRSIPGRWRSGGLEFSLSGAVPVSGAGAGFRTEIALGKQAVGAGGVGASDGLGSWPVSRPEGLGPDGSHKVVGLLRGRR